MVEFEMVEFEMVEFETWISDETRILEKGFFLFDFGVSLEEVV